MSATRFFLAFFLNLATDVAAMDLRGKLPTDAPTSTRKQYAARPKIPRPLQKYQTGAVSRAKTFSNHGIFRHGQSTFEAFI